MGIFNKKAVSNEANGKFIGAWLPLVLSDYLTLYSVATGIAKSQIVLEQMTAWKTKNCKSELNESDLIKMLSDIAIENYSSLNSKRISITMFCNTVKAELRRKKITERSISRIIKRIQNGA